MKTINTRSMKGCDGIPSELLSHCQVERNLGLLLNISHTLESSIRIEDVVRPVLQQISSALYLNRCVLTILDTETNQLRLEEALGLPSNEVPERYMKDLKPILAEVLKQKRSIVITNLSEEKTMQKRFARVDCETPQSQLSLFCIPIKSNNELLGVIAAEKETLPRQSHQTDTQLLTLITRTLAQALKLRIEVKKQISALEEENERLQNEARSPFKHPPEIIGNSSAMLDVYENISQVAPTQATVLIRGESGVGKELVAKAIHEQSPRSKKPFIKFNCAALSDSIIESELFGHEKGSFTGAHALRKGRFEAANGGTIFLDEIGDVSPAVQVKLLRVIQEREFERVGGNEAISVDVRIIAATSRDLEAMVEAHRFRSDLYYRLNVFPIYIPALRERRSDILQLADYFIEKYGCSNSKKPKRISTAAIDYLHSYHWPGNVRELENAIERAAILAGSDAIQARHLPPTLQKATGQSDVKAKGTLNSALEAVEYEIIVNALKENKGNISQTAKQLEISERILGLRLTKYSIEAKKFKP